jgi:hypothetical protein
VTIVDASAGDATGFWEPGLTLQAGDWGRMVDLYRCLLGEASGVVLSGSVPRATPEDAYAQLITIAHDRGVPVVLDAEGAHLLSAPGTLLACLPSTSVPPGYQPKRVHDYLVITVPGNTEIDCGHSPTWLTQIKDLAPPGH